MIPHSRSSRPAAFQREPLRGFGKALFVLSMKTHLNITQEVPTHIMILRIHRLFYSLIVICSTAELFAAEPQVTGNTSAPKEPLSLWYRQPATKWEEALPVGNGRIGAMVFGVSTSERLQLNEDTLWAGGPYDPVNPQAHAALPRSPPARL